MARENQGLQIALIVFVMLTIILGATTYYFYKNMEEARKERDEKQTAASKAAQSLKAKEDEVDDLRKKIGVSKTDDVTALFAEDIKNYGGAYSEDDRFYRPLLEKLAKARDERAAELLKAKADLQAEKDNYAKQLANQEERLKKFEEKSVKFAKDLDSEKAKFASDRKRFETDTKNVHDTIASVRKDSAAVVAKIEENLKDKQADLDKLNGLYRTKSDKLNEVTSKTFDAPEGEIRWVNQRTGVVWINLGRADGLLKQVSFSVYPADITNMTTSSKKAGIEVTQILGDHLAEARVTDDSVVDPVMPGDKINTPLWSPGERRHFALSGFIDLDDDNKSDLQTVINLITLNGGVVDCYLNDKGEVTGEMNANTRYLIRGASPDEKGVSGMLKGNTEMLNNADRLGIQKMPLQDLLDLMGWKNTSHVIRYDRAANLKDFQMKPPEGPQKTAPGNVFTPREPPKKRPTSAY